MCQNRQRPLFWANRHYIFPVYYREHLKWLRYQKKYKFFSKIKPSKLLHTSAWSKNWENSVQIGNIFCWWKQLWKISPREKKSLRNCQRKKFHVRDFFLLCIGRFTFKTINKIRIKFCQEIKCVLVFRSNFADAYLIFLSFGFFFSNRKTRIKSNFHQCQSTSWKMEWSRLLFVYKIDVSIIYVTQVFGQPFQVLIDGFWKWCTWIAISYDVKFYNMLNIYSILNSTNNSVFPQFVFSFCSSNLQSYPFDPKTLIGFFVAFIIQSIVLWYVFMVCTVLICFGINTFIFGISITNFLENALHHTNGIAKVKKNRLAAVNKLTNFMEFQSEGKQLSFCRIYFFNFIFVSNIANKIYRFWYRMVSQFSDIYQPIVALLFIWCIGEYWLFNK